MVHDELQRLMDELIPRAKCLLEKNGALYPIEASLRTDGETRAVAADTGEEYPDADELEDLLIRGFRQDATAREVRAVAWCYTVDVSGLPGIDGKARALKLLAEHERGDVIILYMPFRKRLLCGFEYSDLVRVDGQAQVFG
jgi:hypothetical protein